MRVSGGKLPRDFNVRRLMESLTDNETTTSMKINPNEKNLYTCTGYKKEWSGADTRPYIKVNILGEEFMALIDTGAMVTLVGHKVALHLETHRVKRETLGLDIQLANSSKARIDCRYEFEITIGEVCMDIEAVVLPDLTCDMLLGMDLIGKLSIVRFDRSVSKLSHEEVRDESSLVNKVADALSRNVQNSVPEVSANRPQTQNKTAKLPRTTDDNDKRSLEDKMPEEPCNWIRNLKEKLKKTPRKMQNFLLREGKVYRRFNPTRDKHLNDPSTEWKLCVPANLREKVLQEIHDEETAGHLGFKKTAKRLMVSYYWPGWRQDVRKYVQSCMVCQQAKVEQKKPCGKMFFRNPQGPWHTVTTDLIGPLPRTAKGHTHLLVFQDYYSKWTEINPIRAATARTVSRLFKETILLRYGAPELLISDNGKQYVSDMFGEVAKEWDVKIQFTAPYTPQSNPTERQNRVIKTIISQYVKDDHRSWDVNLKEFMFAINTATHESTKFTPAMLNFGRELSTPKSLRGPRFETTTDETKQGPIHDNRMEKFRTLYEKCHRNLKEAFNRQAHYYNLRRRDNPFVVGQKVMKRTHPLSSKVEHFAGKLAPKFEGPYELVARKGGNIFVLRCDKTNKNTTAHVKDLKHFVDRESNDTP